MTTSQLRILLQWIKAGAIVHGLPQLLASSKLGIRRGQARGIAIGKPVLDIRLAPPDRPRRNLDRLGELPGAAEPPERGGR
jgi:hypothetical protein